MLGYTAEELIGRTPFDLMSGPERAHVENGTRDTPARPRLTTGSNTRVHRDGQLVVLQSSGLPMFGPGGELRGYRG